MSETSTMHWNRLRAAVQSLIVHLEADGTHDTGELQKIADDMDVRTETRSHCGSEICDTETKAMNDAFNQFIHDHGLIDVLRRINTNKPYQHSEHHDPIQPPTSTMAEQTEAAKASNPERTE